MKSQYELARDNIGSLGINVNEFGDSDKMTSQNLNKILFSKKIMALHAFRWRTGSSLSDLNTSRFCSSSNDDVQELRYKEFD